MFTPHPDSDGTHYIPVMSVEAVEACDSGEPIITEPMSTSIARVLRTAPVKAADNQATDALIRGPLFIAIGSLLDYARAHGSGIPY